jgi:hypothetical protein
MCKNLFFILFGIQWMVGCYSPASFTGFEKKQVTDSVRATLNNYYADIKKEGLMAEFNYLDHSEDFFWVPPGYKNPIFYDSVKTILTQQAPVYVSIENTWKRLYIFPLSASLASYSGTLRSTMVDTAGHTTHVNLIETGVMIKRKNGWKLLNGQTSMIQ